MTSGKTLRKLIKAGISGNLDEFRRASEEIIEDEERKQHHRLAKELKAIISNDHVPPTQVSQSKRSLLPIAPIDQERGFPLLDIRAPSKRIDQIVVPKSCELALAELIEEHRRSDILHSYGLTPSHRVILFGPPGCGKTLAAEVIAQELDLPFAVVRLDALVSSFLGETAANLRRVFEFISQHTMVVLFDEFDAIGKERGNGSEHGELRRVVNAVLQMMDSYNGKSVILAATNHESILDTAIWRRFEESIEFPLPDDETIPRLLELKLRGVKHDLDHTWEDLCKSLSGKSGADIERIIVRSTKRSILSNKSLTLEVIKGSIARDGR